MDSFICQLDNVVMIALRLYSLILLIYAILSWIPDLRGEWVRYIAMLVEPLLQPLRRVIPPMGGLDLSFLVLILLLNLVIAPLVASATNAACLAV